MAQATYRIFEEDFVGRCIDFGGKVVAHYVLFWGQRQLAGKLIAPLTLKMEPSRALPTWRSSHKDFEGIAGLEVINPCIRTEPHGIHRP